MNFLCNSSSRNSSSLKKYPSNLSYYFLFRKYWYIHTYFSKQWYLAILAVEVPQCNGKRYGSSKLMTESKCCYGELGLLTQTVLCVWEELNQELFYFFSFPSSKGHLVWLQLGHKSWQIEYCIKWGQPQSGLELGWVECTTNGCLEIKYGIMTVSGTSFLPYAIQKIELMNFWMLWIKSKINKRERNWLHGSSLLKTI